MNKRVMFKRDSFIFGIVLYFPVFNFINNKRIK